MREEYILKSVFFLSQHSSSRPRMGMDKESKKEQAKRKSIKAQ